MSGRDNNFVKVHLRLTNHPAVVAGGFGVDLVFTLLLRIARDMSEDGRIPAECLDAAYLRRVFRMGDEFTDEMLRDGLSGVLAGRRPLVVVDGDEAVFPTWEDDYAGTVKRKPEADPAEAERKAKSHADRQAEYKRRKRARVTPGDAGDAGDARGDGGDVTADAGDGGDAADAGDAVDKRRGDETTVSGDASPRVTLSPSPRHPSPTQGSKPAANEDDLGTLADLETLVLDCLPPAKRRGAMFLSPVQTRDLLALVEKYGRAAVADTLGGCGGADMPLAMARKRLESAHRAPSVGPSAVEAPVLRVVPAPAPLVKPPITPSMAVDLEAALAACKRRP